MSDLYKRFRLTEKKLKAHGFTVVRLDWPEDDLDQVDPDIVLANGIHVQVSLYGGYGITQQTDDESFLCQEFETFADLLKGLRHWRKS